MKMNYAGEYFELTGPETLEMVKEDYWKVTSFLILFLQNEFLKEV